MAANPSALIGKSGQALAEFIDRLPEIWRKPSSYPKDACAILLILAICAAAAIAGAVHTTIYGHDIFVMLDGGWRVLNGQRPAVDFSPGIGPFSLLIMAAGLKLAHNSVRGIGYASALVAGAVGLWSYLLGRRRMAWMPSALTSSVLALIAAAPYPLGLLPNQLSHAMVYNRYGYALLGVVMLESFQMVKGDRPGQSLFSGISAGVITVFLLFLKPSFGLVALVFMGISILLGWRSRWRSLGIAVGLVAGGLAAMAFLRFEFSTAWHDIQLVAAARSGTLSAWAVRWALMKGLPDFLWLALLAMLVSLIRSYKQPLVRSLEPLAIAMAVLIAQALLLATNAQAAGYPLNAVLAIMLAEQGRIAAKDSGIGPLPGFLRADTIVLLVALLCFVPTFTANASSLGDALVQNTRHPPDSEVPRFNQPHLASLLLYDVPYGTESDRRSNGRVYVNYVNDGVDLIRKFSKPDEKVAALDLANPFSYALLRPPPHGGSACMDFNYQFNDQYKPSPEWLFGSADIVMVPKHPAGSEPTAEALARNYLASIHAAFRLCAESEWWELYKRPSNLSGCPARR